jgi:hypothetical protein
MNIKKILTKRLLIALLLGILVTVFVPRYITYDTGVNCITEACNKASSSTSYFGWWMEGQPDVLDEDFAIPTIGFLIYSALIYWLYPKIIKKLQD